MDLTFADQWSMSVDEIYQLGVELVLLISKLGT